MMNDENLRLSGSRAVLPPSHDTISRRLEHKSFSYRPLEIKTRLGALNSRACWPQTAPARHPTFLGAAPGPHGSLPVVPLIPDKRYYGEAPGRLR